MENIKEMYIYLSKPKHNFEFTSGTHNMVIENELQSKNIRIYQLKASEAAIKSFA